MKDKRIISFLFFFLCSSLCSAPVYAASDGSGISSAVFKEISNGRTITLFPFLPSLRLPDGMTIHFFMLLMSAALMLSVFFYVRQHVSLRPKGLVVVLENLILFVQDDIVFPIMGRERGRVWLPFFSTLFIFLLTVNFLGLIPAFRTATGNINITSALAVMILLLIFVVGLKNLGVADFFKNLYPQGMALPVGIFVAILEFLGIFIKSSVLSVRLFANMFAGHLAIISFLTLIFILNPAVGIVTVPLTLFTYALEVVIALIQALVFTLLSCQFITMASSAEAY